MRKAADMEEQLVRDEIRRLDGEIAELGRELAVLIQRENVCPGVSDLRVQQIAISHAIFKKQGVVEWLEALPLESEEEAEE